MANIRAFIAGLSKRKKLALGTAATLPILAIASILYVFFVGPAVSYQQSFKQIQATYDSLAIGQEFTLQKVAKHEQTDCYHDYRNKVFCVATDYTLTSSLDQSAAIAKLKAAIDKPQFQSCKTAEGFQISLSQTDVSTDQYKLSIMRC